MLRGTYLEIDLNALENNLNIVRKTIGDIPKILLAIKADAYGHGCAQLGRFTQEKNLVNVYGVASIIEGIELRNAGVYLPILNLSLIVPNKESIDAILDFNICQTISNLEVAIEINKRAAKRDFIAKVHLKVDTGMGRIGCKPNEALSIIKEIEKLSNIELDGVFTHMPVSDHKQNNSNQNQISIFNSLVKEIKSEHKNIKYIHMANSAAILNFKETHLDMVRPGIMAYGYNPTSDAGKDFGLKPVMSFKSQIVFLKTVEKDTPVSYGHTYKTTNSCNLATIPVGYGDGYSRLLSNIGKVKIGNKKYPVVGRVCMDQILVNLGDDIYPVGQEVILFGQDDITAETIAREIGTISYEITCGISKRVPRIYKNSKNHYN